MSRRLEWSDILFLGLVLAAIGLHQCSPVRAQETTVDRVTQWRLAQLFCHEAGCGGERDHAGIFHVLRNRLTAGVGGNLLETIHSYSAARLLIPRTRHTRAIAALRPGELYPSRPKWPEALARAGAYLREPPASPCRYGRPDHWGARNHPIDRTRGDRAVRDGRWRKLWCGRTRNDFYQVRRLRL